MPGMSSLCLIVAILASEAMTQSNLIATLNILQVEKLDYMC